MAERDLTNLILWVTDAHHDQVYNHPDGDQPYVFHVFRVASAVSPGAVPAALLHDCLEDTGCFPPGWIGTDTHEAVKLLTRDDECYRYEHYIGRLLSAEGVVGEIAREVKIADLRDNLSNIRPGHRESLRPRYEAALQRLAPPEPESSEYPWNGCFSGDCPHEKSSECVEHLRGYVAELEQENFRLRAVPESEPVAWRKRRPHSIVEGEMGHWRVFNNEPVCCVGDEIEPLYTHLPVEPEGAREALRNALTEREWDRVMAVVPSGCHELAEVAKINAAVDKLRAALTSTPEASPPACSACGYKYRLTDSELKCVLPQGHEGDHEYSVQEVIDATSPAVTERGEPDAADRLIDFMTDNEGEQDG